MFQDPKDAHRYLEDGRYRLRLIRFDPLEPHPEWGARVRWVFHTWDLATQKQVTDERGFPREFFQQTSTKMGKKAKAREWMEALLGRSITEDDNGQALAKEVVGKYADALIGGNDGGYDAIVQIRPVKQGAATPADPNPSPMPGSNAEPPEEPPDEVLAERLEEPEAAPFA